MDKIRRILFWIFIVGILGYFFYETREIWWSRPADTTDIEKALNDTLHIDDSLQQRQGCIACDTAERRAGK